MAAMSLQRALLLAGAALPFAQLGLAQTLVDNDGRVIRMSCDARAATATRWMHTCNLTDS